jgi:hypothetical protein
MKVYLNVLSQIVCFNNLLAQSTLIMYYGMVQALPIMFGKVPK